MIIVPSSISTTAPADTSTDAIAPAQAMSAISPSEEAAANAPVMACSARVSIDPSCGSAACCDKPCMAHDATGYTSQAA